VCLLRDTDWIFYMYFKLLSARNSGFDTSLLFRICVEQRGIGQVSVPVGPLLLPAVSTIPPMLRTHFRLKCYSNNKQRFSGIWEHWRDRCYY